MTQHRRTPLVEGARREIASSLLDLRKKHELTTVEYLQILTGAITEALKFELRYERHPDNPDAPADIE